MMSFGYLFLLLTSHIRGQLLSLKFHTLLVRQISIAKGIISTKLIPIHSAHGPIKALVFKIIS